MRKFEQLTLQSRIKMETMLNTGFSVPEVAEYLGCHRSTIYREKKRGQYIHLNSDYTEEVRYSSDLGQEYHEWHAQSKGRNLKIGNDRKLAKFIEKTILEKQYSPEATLALISRESEKYHFSVSITTRTLYNYIDKGIFLHLTNKDLPVKRNKKRQYKKVRTQKKAAAGTSIEKRPEEVLERNSFGHWEMDTVKGARGITKSCLLVLSERFTRKEIVIKQPDQTAASVVKSLDCLERKWGSRFCDVFKTITVDNGVEFSDSYGIERSCIKKGKRTSVYYCHPYRSCERGTNENINRLIRRHIPKGENLDVISSTKIHNIEKWINNYPRRIFGFQTAEERFQNELEKMVYT